MRIPKIEGTIMFIFKAKLSSTILNHDLGFFNKMIDFWQITPRYY